MSARVTVDRADLEAVLAPGPLRRVGIWFSAADRLRAALAPEPEMTEEPEGALIDVVEAAIDSQVVIDARHDAATAIATIDAAGRLVPESGRALTAEQVHWARCLVKIGLRHLDVPADIRTSLPDALGADR